MGFNSGFKGLNAELNVICYLLVLLGAHPILHVSRIRVNIDLRICTGKVCHARDIVMSTQSLI